MHIPERTCIGCGKRYPKEELIRLTRTSGGDITWRADGKGEGRGAYLCPAQVCLDRAAKRKSLSRALRSPIAGEIYEQLREEMRGLVRE